MEHYVTLFDSLFLPQGLALHMSMMRHMDSFRLWILCVDDEAHDVLTRLQLANTRLLRLSQVETEELRKVKISRSKGEYCWTLTPFAPRFVFEADETVERVTYLDADLWFRKNSRPIFREFEKSGKQVMITDHAYAPEYDQSALAGQYCVQFMTFARTGETVRKWWEDRCIEWCHARFEDGKFGDQKYLDDWPERFRDQVHVLEDKELLMAPWNATRFPYGNALAWHFHAVRISDGLLGSRRAYLGPYVLPTVVKKFIYLPYLEDLKSALKMLRQAGIETRSQEASPTLRKLKELAYRLHQRFSLAGKLRSFSFRE